MRKLIGVIAAGGLIAGAAAQVQAANWTLDFNELQRGEIVDNQYASGIPGASSTSVAISGIGGQGNVAVSFDTNNATGGSNNGVSANDGDSDLSHQFNNTSTNFGNVLIVQESFAGTTSCGGSSCLGGGIIPDDDVGSSLVFEFGDTPTNLTSIDYFDIENTTNNALSLEITYADSSVVTQQLAAVGNHSWGIFNFGNLGLNVAKLVAIFTGSGAVDNLKGSDRTTTVNEPGTLAIFLTGLIALALYRRRRPQEA